jgi:hypothetical protein
LQYREKSGGGRFFAAFRGGTATGVKCYINIPKIRSKIPIWSA